MDIKPSVSIEINNRATELKKQGKKILNLSIGQPKFPISNDLKGYLNSSINEDKTFYTDSRGIIELRESILEWHNIENIVTKENVLVTPGAKYAIYLILKALLNKGDEVIVFEPYWLSYLDIVTLCDGVSRVVEVNKEFTLNIEALEQSITERTKVIIINSPNNPSGKLLSLTEVNNLITIAQKYNLYIVADEIYSTIIYDVEHVSFLNYVQENENIVVVNGVSKSLSCTGLRIGYIVTSLNIIKQLLPIHQHIATCAGSLEQYALSKLSRESYHEIVAQHNEYYKEMKGLLLSSELVRRVAVVPEGTFYMLLYIKGKYENSYEASKYLLDCYGIATVPGIAYGLDNYIRISFACSREEISEFIKIVDENKIF